MFLEGERVKVKVDKGGVVKRAKLQQWKLIS